MNACFVLYFTSTKHALTKDVCLTSGPIHVHESFDSIVLT